MDWVNIALMMDLVTRDIGKTARCMAKATIFTQIKICIMASLYKIKPMDMDSFSRQMEIYIAVFGRMISHTAQENKNWLIHLTIMANLKMV